MSVPARRRRHNPLDESLDALEQAEREEKAAVEVSVEPAEDLAEPEPIKDAAPEAREPASETAASPSPAPDTPKAPKASQKAPKAATSTSTQPNATEALQLWAASDVRGQLQAGRRAVNTIRWGSQIDPDQLRRLKAASALSGEMVYSIVERGVNVVLELAERELGIYKDPESDD